MPGSLPKPPYSPDHAHPHVRPRQPLPSTVVSVNPPVFAWYPGTSEADKPDYSFTLSTSPTMNNPLLHVQGLTSPIMLPEKPLPVGTYYWNWTSRSERGDIWRFVVPEEAAAFSIPAASEIRSLAAGPHPKTFLRAGDLGTLRARYKELLSASPHTEANHWTLETTRQLTTRIDQTMNQSHSMEEPPMLADRRVDFEAFWDAWYRINWASRRFMRGAELLGLGYLLTGERRYGESCAERLLSVASWDPDGSSSIAVNDEAHMSVFWHMPIAADYVWDILREDERQIILSHIRKRGINTFDHSRRSGEYGITRFDSHAGREIVFLGMAALAFSDELSEASEWLEWLRPVLCGIWPVWGKDDGGWAEGPAYGLTYVTIMTTFASALKAITGVDLYRKPFWQNHADWRCAFHPPYAQWIGFGDHTERWQEFWQGTSYLVRLLDLETGQHRHGRYSHEMFEESKEMTQPAERGSFPFPSQLIIRSLLDQTPHNTAYADASPRSSLLDVFPDVGWASVSTESPEQPPDLRFLFRSSPFGSVSHSHANNNDFALHVAGKALLIPSGYFAGFSSNHHSHWVWHTKSHNAATLGGASQFIRSYSSQGEVMGAFEDSRMVYFCGVADSSYAHMADAYRRHVVYIKDEGAFIVTDEIVLKPGIFVPVEWNLHSWYEFSIDKTQGSCTVSHDGTGVEVTHLSPYEFYFSPSEAWVPPPNFTYKESSEWRDQHHVQIVPSDLLARKRVISVVLAPFHRDRVKATVAQEVLPVGVPQSDRTAHNSTVGEARVVCYISPPPSPGSLYGLPDQRRAVDKSGTTIASDDDPLGGTIMSITIGDTEYVIEQTGLSVR